MGFCDGCGLLFWVGALDDDNRCEKCRCCRDCGTPLDEKGGCWLCNKQEVTNGR